jgi:hypothetical protein
MKTELNLQMVSFIAKVGEIDFFAFQFGKKEHPAVFNLEMLKELFRNAGECPDMEKIHNHLFGLENSINDDLLDGTPEGTILFRKIRTAETEAKIIFRSLKG